MVESLWGENYFDPNTRKWTSKDTGSATCSRGFVQFCYIPIKQIIDLCMKENIDKKLWDILSRIGVTLKSDEKELTWKPLMKCVMQSWLPLSTALLKMMIFHLPSPCTAQRYRMEKLYEGPVDDKYADANTNCEPNGPLMIYVSKMIPASKKGRFFAFGRAFSGTVSNGLKVRKMRPNFVVGDSISVYPTIKDTVILMGSEELPVKDVPAGNTVALYGLDKLIIKTATLTNKKDDEAHPFRAMKFCVLPVLRIAVKCSDHHRLVRGLNYLAKSDPIIDCTIEKSPEGEPMIIAGTGELHLIICKKDLQNDFMDGCEITFSETFAVFHETVTEKSPENVTIKSKNDRIRLKMIARPLENRLVLAIVKGRIGPGDDLAKSLAREFGWEKDIADKIAFWA